MLKVVSEIFSITTKQAKTRQFHIELFFLFMTDDFLKSTRLFQHSNWLFT